MYVPAETNPDLDSARNRLRSRKHPCTNYNEFTMAKKKESLVDEVKKIVGKATEKADEIVEEIVKDVKEGIEAIEDTLEGKSKNVKKEAKNKSDKKSALLERAKALAGKVEGEEKIGIKEIKGKVKGEEEEKKTIVPIEDYLKASLHLGTRVITPDMKQYVYRRRADGLAVFNTSLQDDKIREAVEFLAKYAPEQIVLACKREAGWKAVEKFGETLGIKVFTKKYPAGTLTNTNLEDFFERDLAMICDPWLDKNLLVDSNKIKIPVFGICDTNNFTKGINFVLPVNNKSYKSLGMVFYLLTKLYAEKRGIKIKEPKIKDFIEDWDSLVPPQ